MAAGDEKQDELEKLLGKSDSRSTPQPPGTFTRAFFGVEQAKPQNPAEPAFSQQSPLAAQAPFSQQSPLATQTPAEQPDQQPAVPSYPRTASTPGEFTRMFGRPSDSQPPALNAEERPQPATQNLIPSSEPGTSTGLFAAPNQISPKPSAQAPSGYLEPQAAIDSYPRPASTPGEFTRIFGSPNTDSQPPVLRAEERSPAIQNGIPSPEPGTSTGLFATPSQAPPRTSNAPPSTFTAFFHSELPAVTPVQSSTDFRPLSSSATPAPSVGADFPRQVSPGINVPKAEKAIEDIGTGFAPFPDPNPGHNQEKATRLFSLPETTAAGRTASASGPSAFTRIIASSAQRSAEEKTAPSAAPVSNPLPQTAGAPMIAAPVVTPQWPAANMPAPVHPAGYLPQQPTPPQIAMPPVAQVSWPQAPPSPAVQMDSGEQTPQKWWITYLPLIIGLNVLFFVAVILILIFALAR